MSTGRKVVHKSRVDELISIARRWHKVNVAKVPKFKDLWRDRWIETLEELARDRELCRKLDAVQPKGEGSWRLLNDGYGLVQEGLRALTDWSTRTHRSVAAHRTHYSKLAASARALATELRAEDTMLIPISQLTGNWIDDRSLRAFLGQVTDAAGLQLSTAELARIADFPGKLLKLYTPSVPKCLDEIAANLDMISTRGTDTPRPSDPESSRRSYVLRRLLDFSETHHKATNQSILAAVASLLLGSDVAPSQVSRVVNDGSRKKRKTCVVAGSS